MDCLDLSKNYNTLCRVCDSVTEKVVLAQVGRREAAII